MGIADNQTNATTKNENIMQLVSFNIAEEEFGINIMVVKEIIRMIDITRVPNTHNYVHGVINLRGKVVPIIDLRKRLGMPSKDISSETRIIVIELDSNMIGFIVDQVNEVININALITEESPKLSTNINSDFIKSIAKLKDRLLILLDLEKIIIEDSAKSIVPQAQTA